MDINIDDFNNYNWDRCVVINSHNEKYIPIWSTNWDVYNTNQEYNDKNDIYYIHKCDNYCPIIVGNKGFL